MLFEAKGFYIDLIENNDLVKIVEVYNSNKHFLAGHMDKEKITNEWMIKELQSMKEAGFYSCKIVEKCSEKLIGVLEFKQDIETYLSLIMIHNNYKSKGIGKTIFDAFEEYLVLSNCKCIRIDVVTNYDSSVLEFWTKNKFLKINDIELNWTGKLLPAVIMKKYL
ncbi:MAG: GCN5-related N-acetyltransferase [Herbinix sp.]|jgi:ribosomal protein S18 acetylase RimI-like enzyme|nr:GCN5-related N-acetyltransferase [Herbinix sp.]